MTKETARYSSCLEIDCDENTRSKLSDLLAGAENIQSELESSMLNSSSMLQKFPPERYLRMCSVNDATAYCNDTPAPQLKFLEELSAEYGSDAACLYNQLALVQLSLNCLERHAALKLPEPVIKNTWKWFERIYKDILQKEPGYYDLLAASGPHLDDLKLDFAVCAGRALPVGGAWIVEHRRLVKSKLFGSTAALNTARKPAATSRLYSILKRAAIRFGALDSLVILRSKWHELMKHYGDYLVIHTANRYRQYFSEKHLHTAYRNVALLLEQDEGEHLGLYRSSWFLDPEVVKLEPKLSFLSKTPVQNGAKYGPVKPIQGSNIKAILDRSAVRTAAFKKGDYQPWAWAYLWLRDDLLAWTASH